MKEDTLALYHALPSSLRSTAASLWGLYLRWWRYGPETEQLIDEYLERESWSPEKWRKWQEECLTYVLWYAATRVPYYVHHWAKRRRHGDRKSWEYLENWPLLEKETLQNNSAAFVSSEYNTRRMYHEHTSGTTGKPLDIWLSSEGVKAWYALYEARCRRWYNVSRYDRWAILGGQLIVPARQRVPPFWVWNQALNQLYLSSYHLAPDLMPYYIEALDYYKVRYILGFPSTLYALGREIVRKGYKSLHMTVALTNAEPAYSFQKKVIAEAFQCPVRETYGMAEIVTAASECSMGRLHIWPEVGWVELIDDEVPSAKGRSGEVICSSLLNLGMPLIRYRTGDRAIMSSQNCLCPCGRTLPVWESVEGRVDDVLYTIEGKCVGRLDSVFKENLPLEEAQIIQEDLDKIRVRYVAADNFSAVDGQSIVKRLQDRMGPVEVVLEPVDSIPRTASGKFRAVISKVSRTNQDFSPQP